MPKIKVKVWLEHARRYAAAAGQIAQQAQVRADEAQGSSQERCRRACDLIEKGQAALARGRERRVP